MAINDLCIVRVSLLVHNYYAFKELGKKCWCFLMNANVYLLTLKLNFKVKCLTCELTPVMKMNKITYYSFHIDGDAQCEVEKFVTRFSQPAHEQDYGNIMSVIRDMGMNRGAEANYFRHERAAEALPPPYRSGEVRLYCCRITKEVVILGNGCLKTSQKVQQSEACLLHFEIMNALAKQITARITSRDLEIINKQFKGNLQFKIGDCYE